MRLFLALLLLGSLAIYAQPVNFTINSVGLLATPSLTLKNGEQLKLKCKVDFAKTTNFELTSVIYFYKDDIMIHNVTTQSSEATYIIPQARVSTSGPYTCKVFAGNKEQSSDEIQIKVTGLSRPRIILSKNEVTEGDDVTVRCEAPEEEPPMKFHFYKSIGQAKDAPKTKTTGTNFAESTFKINEGESILSFECDVILVSVDEPKSELSDRRTVTVVAPFGTPMISVRPSNNFTEGTKMEVTCSVLTSHINPQEVTITLQRGSHILTSSTSARLTHSQVASETDTGNYTCKVEGGRASKSNSTIIKVQELFPKPFLQLIRKSNAPAHISEDEQLLLDCSIPGYQESIKQDFYLNHRIGKQRMERGRFQMTVKEDDSRQYTCEVTIANITKRSNTLGIKVYAAVSKPILRQVVTGNRMVVLGDTLILTCQSLAGTPPIQYTLLRGSDRLGSIEVGDYTAATFRVNVTKPHDLGQYRCQAGNRNPKHSLFSDVLNVTVITPVRNIKLIIIPGNGEVEEGSELSLVCSVMNGTLPINFQFYVNKNHNNILLHNVTVTDHMSASYQVPSFAKQKDGDYFCSASNQASSQANKIISSKTMEVKVVLASWKKGVIGAFILIIILAAIGIIVYLYLDKRKKEKNISTAAPPGMTKVDYSTNETSAVEMKSDAVYYGSVQNEEELHILKATEDTMDNSQQNHDMNGPGHPEEAEGPAPDTHPDPVENNVSGAEEPQESNNLS